MHLLKYTFCTHLRDAQPLSCPATGILRESYALRRHDGVFMKKICGTSSKNSESGCEEFLHDGQPAPQSSQAALLHASCDTDRHHHMFHARALPAQLRVLIGCI